MHIVPSNKLLFWASIALLPSTLLWAIMPQLALLVTLYIIAFCLLFLFDAYISSDKLMGIQMKCPELIRLSKESSRDFLIHITMQTPSIRHLKIGIPFPQEIYTRSRIRSISLSKESPGSSLSWTIKGLKPGEYRIQDCFLEACSSMGFWTVRRSKKLDCQIRIYPNLLSEQRDLSGLFMNNNLGIHARSQVGKGREFEQLREYIPGDCYEDIHWKATAKRRHPVTKMYQIERTQHIYIIIDTSRLSARSLENGSGHLGKLSSVSTILEKFVSAALIMGLAAQRQGDLFGVLTFENKITHFLRASSGKAHYNSVRDTLFRLEPNIVTPDYSELFTFIGTKIRQRSLLIFLTSLDDPVLSESFIQQTRIAGKQHLMLVNMFNPRGAYPLFSSSDPTSVNDLYKYLAGHLIWNNLYETKKILRSRNIDSFLLDKEKIFVQLVSQYLDIKQRQIL